jgi:hypothetical protein
VYRNIIPIIPQLDHQIPITASTHIINPRDKKLAKRLKLAGRLQKDRSTDHAKYTLVNGILQAWNSKLQVAGIFCYLAKDFDCVNHGILIKS